MVMNIANALSAYKQADVANMGKGLTAAKSDAGAQSFSDTLMGFVGDAVKSVKEGETMAAKGTMGKADLQEVILAVNNAEMMMQTVTSIRDKVITAYQEVLRTAI